MGKKHKASQNFGWCISYLSAAMIKHCSHGNLQTEVSLALCFQKVSLFRWGSRAARTGIAIKQETESVYTLLWTTSRVRLSTLNARPQWCKSSSKAEPPKLPNSTTSWAPVQMLNLPSVFLTHSSTVGMNNNGAHFSVRDKSCPDKWTCHSWEVNGVLGTEAGDKSLLWNSFLFWRCQSLSPTTKH